jgi:hypothetical protein
VATNEGFPLAVSSIRMDLRVVLILDHPLSKEKASAHAAGLNPQKT